MKLFSKINVENKGLFVLVWVLYWGCPDQIAASVKYFAQNFMTIPAYKFVTTRSSTVSLLH